MKEVSHVDIWGRTWQAEGTADSHEYVEIVKTVGWLEQK